MDRNTTKAGRLATARTTGTTSTGSTSSRPLTSACTAAGLRAVQAARQAQRLAVQDAAASTDDPALSRARRETLRQATRQFIPRGTLTAQTPGRWQHDGLAYNTDRRNPAGDLLEHALWAVRVRRAAGHAGADIARDMLPLFEALLSEVRIACDGDARGLTLADAVVADAREAGEAHVAVVRLATTPADAPEYPARLAEATREQTEAVVAGRRLVDGLHVERFRLLQATPRGTPLRAL